jgi:putative transposase
MARENPGWAIGVSRASRLGHHIASSTVWRILQAAGIDPASRRAGPTWTHFLTQQAKAVLAVDLVHIDTVVLRRIYALIVVEHGWRRVHLAGITAHPSGAWTDSTPANRHRSLAQLAPAQVETGPPHWGGRHHPMRQRVALCGQGPVSAS